MNENIDLTKILKNCPKGFELYSTIHGKVYFNLITKNKEYPICLLYNKDFIHFTKDGRWLVDKSYGECILFPSKEQRDWSKFTAPWLKKERFDPKTLQPFDKVLVYDIYDICEGWACSIFSHIKESEYPYSTSSGSFKICIPYNDDTKHLIGTIDKAPEYYRYWEE